MLALGGLSLGKQGGFSPLSFFLAGEKGVWFDPSDFTTLFQDTAGTTPVTATGQSVARINDKSGNGFHATQATAGSRPTLQQDGTGRYFLLFDGTDDGMATASITPGIDKIQMFAGVRKLSDATTGMVAELSADLNSNTGTFFFAAPTGAAANYIFNTKGSLPAFGAGATSAGFAAPITSVVAGIGDIAADTSILRVNGTQVATSASDQGTGNYGAYPLYIGRRNGATVPFNGRLYGLVVRFGSNLSTSQIAQAEAWMNAATGAY